jgi:hypothetical protein
MSVGPDSEILGGSAQGAGPSAPSVDANSVSGTADNPGGWSPRSGDASFGGENVTPRDVAFQAALAARESGTFVGSVMVAASIGARANAIGVAGGNLGRDLADDEPLAAQNDANFYTKGSAALADVAAAPYSPDKVIANAEAGRAMPARGLSDGTPAGRPQGGMAIQYEPFAATGTGENNKAARDVLLGNLDPVGRGYQEPGNGVSAMRGAQAAEIANLAASFNIDLAQGAVNFGNSVAMASKAGATNFAQISDQYYGGNRGFPNAAIGGASTQQIAANIAAFAQVAGIGLSPSYRQELESFGATPDVVASVAPIMGEAITAAQAAQGRDGVFPGFIDPSQMPGAWGGMPGTEMRGTGGGVMVPQYATDFNLAGRLGLGNSPIGNTYEMARVAGIDPYNQVQSPLGVVDRGPDLAPPDETQQGPSGPFSLQDLGIGGITPVGPMGFGGGLNFGGGQRSDLGSGAQFAQLDDSQNPANAFGRVDVGGGGFGQFQGLADALANSNTNDPAMARDPGSKMDNPIGGGTGLTGRAGNSFGTSDYFSPAPEINSPTPWGFGEPSAPPQEGQGLGGSVQLASMDPPIGSGQFSGQSMGSMGTPGVSGTLSGLGVAESSSGRASSPGPDLTGNGFGAGPFGFADPSGGAGGRGQSVDVSSTFSPSAMGQGTFGQASFAPSATDLGNNFGTSYPGSGAVDTGYGTAGQPSGGFANVAGFNAAPGGAVVSNGAPPGMDPGVWGAANGLLTGMGIGAGQSSPSGTQVASNDPTPDIIVTPSDNVPAATAFPSVDTSGGPPSRPDFSGDTAGTYSPEQMAQGTFGSSSFNPAAGIGFAGSPSGFSPFSSVDASGGPPSRPDLSGGIAAPAASSSPFSFAEPTQMTQGGFNSAAVGYQGSPSGFTTAQAVDTSGGPVSRPNMGSFDFGPAMRGEQQLSQALSNFGAGSFNAGSFQGNGSREAGGGGDSLPPGMVSIPDFNVQSGGGNLPGYGNSDFGLNFSNTEPGAAGGPRADANIDPALLASASFASLNSTPGQSGMFGQAAGHRTVRKGTWFMGTLRTHDPNYMEGYYQHEAYAEAAGSTPEQLHASCFGPGSERRLQGTIFQPSSVRLQPTNITPHATSRLAHRGRADARPCVRGEGSAGACVLRPMVL